MPKCVTKTHNWQYNSEKYFVILLYKIFIKLNRISLLLNRVDEILFIKGDSRNRVLTAKRWKRNCLYIACGQGFTGQYRVVWLSFFVEHLIHIYIYTHILHAIAAPWQAKVPALDFCQNDSQTYGLRFSALPRGFEHHWNQVFKSSRQLWKSNPESARSMCMWLLSGTV